MSTVYVVSEPARWDPAVRAWVRTVDVTPAARFGRLEFLLPPGDAAVADPAEVCRVLRAKLAGFTHHDYLLPVGSPLHIAWAAVIAAERSGGHLNLLHWQIRRREYLPVGCEPLRAGHGARPAVASPSPERESP